MSEEIITPSDLYNDKQYAALLACRFLGSVLGLVGAGCLVYMTSRQNAHRKIKERLLMGLSIANALFALGLFSTPFMVPSYLRIPLASGNNSTCAFVGFLFLAAFLIGSIYNAYISLYFFLVVHRKWKESDFTKTTEWVAHAFAFVVPTTMFLAGAITGSFHVQPHAANLCLFGCDHFPEETVELQVCSDRDAGPMAIVLSHVFPLLVWLSSGVAFCCVIKVWMSVHKTVHRSSAYRFENQLNSSSEESGNPNPTQPSTTTPLDKRNEERLQQLWRQTMCYALAYFNCFVWVLIGVALSTDQQDPKPVSPGVLFLRLLSSLFAPLQGFLNLFVYTRPDFLHWRQQEPDRSFAWVFRQILTNQKMPDRTMGRSSLAASAGRNQFTRPTLTVTRMEDNSSCQPNKDEQKRQQIMSVQFTDDEASMYDEEDYREEDNQGGDSDDKGTDKKPAANA